MKDLTIVMQGPIYQWTADFADRYAEFPFVNRVIISTWLDQQIPYRGHQRIQLAYPSNKGKGNRNLQIISSLEGIRKVETEYCLKVRSDLFCPQLENMWKFFKEHYEFKQIYTLSIYKPLQFHPRDWLFLGKTQDLFHLFNIPLDEECGSYIETQNIRSEAYIGMYYYCQFEKKMINMIYNAPEYMTDQSPKRIEALKVYHELIKQKKGFIPFPRVQVDIPKHYPKGYPFEELKARYGEMYYDDMIEFIEGK